MWLSPAEYRSRPPLAPLIPLLLLLYACEGEAPGMQPGDTVIPPTESRIAGLAAGGNADVPRQSFTTPEPALPERLTLADPSSPADNAVSPRFSVGDNQYMFDVSDHSQEELVALLKRADEVASVSSPETDKLDIALILHGPDIGWFARKNYQDNKELVDLAARLDALEVIDMKVCQKSIRHYGYVDEDIPAFIDRVPYAPDEMRRLEDSGYYRL